MTNEIIFIIIEIVILYISILIISYWYKKKEIEKEERILVLEKRIQENTRLINYQIENVINYIDLMMKGKKKNGKN